MPLICGIDAGWATGGVALIGYGKDEGFAELHDLPLKKGEGVIAPQLLDLLAGGDDVRHIICEQQGPRPRQGVRSTFSLGCGYGQILATMQLSGIGYSVVHPTKWKRDLELNGLGKDAAMEMARQLFPSARESMSRKKDEHKCEAALIAHWKLKYERKTT